MLQVSYKSLAHTISHIFLIVTFPPWMIITMVQETIVRCCYGNAVNVSEQRLGFKLGKHKGEGEDLPPSNKKIQTPLM